MIEVITKIEVELFKCSDGGRIAVTYKKYSKSGSSERIIYAPLDQHQHYCELADRLAGELIKPS